MNFDWLYFFTGYDRKEKTIDWRGVYFSVSIIIILFLGYEALFVYPLEMDAWGLTSIYLTKLIVIMLILCGVYFVWGYMRLVDEVEILREKVGVLIQMIPNKSFVIQKNNGGTK